jgi:hypothetical protein
VTTPDDGTRAIDLLPYVRAFTTGTRKGLFRVLKNRCKVSAAWLPDSGTPRPKTADFDAIWDTGATNSAITQAVIDECGLLPSGMAQVHGVHGSQETETFLVNIELPDNVVFTALKVSKGAFRDADILIGMDIISRGDFSVTNCDGRSQFSYRAPSMEHIDYVALVKAAREARAEPKNRAARRRAKLGRS